MQDDLMSVVFQSLQAGESPLQLGPKAEERGKVSGNPISFLLRLLLGTTAGFYYFLVRTVLCCQCALSSRVCQQL
jgi:hypothetical protein